MATFADILTDVSALCATGSFSTSAARVTRKKLIRLEGDPTTLCIISPQGWRIVEDAFESKDIIDFLVGVVLIYPGNWAIETGLSTILNEADVIRRSLNVTSLPTATKVFDSEIDLQPPFDLTALEKANFDVCPFLVTYRSNESRT